MLTAKEVAYQVTKALDAKKGMNISLLKIDRVSSLADYFLICTGTSSTHVKTLCDYAELTLENLGETLLGREGHRGNSWELLDFGTVVVHVFTDEAVILVNAHLRIRLLMKTKRHRDMVPLAVGWIDILRICNLIEPRLTCSHAAQIGIDTD